MCLRDLHVWRCRAPHPPLPWRPCATVRPYPLPASRTQTGHRCVPLGPLWLKSGHTCVRLCPLRVCGSAAVASEHLWPPVYVGVVPARQYKHMILARKCIPSAADFSSHQTAILRSRCSTDMGRCLHHVVTSPRAGAAKVQSGRGRRAAIVTPIGLEEGRVVAMRGK